MILSFHRSHTKKLESGLLIGQETIRVICAVPIGQNAAIRWLLLISVCIFACVMSSEYTRLQNSPYFCVFKYARAVKQKVWNEAENRERDWGETLKIRLFSLASHARSRASRA